MPSPMLAIHWVNTSTMLAGSLTKTGYPARVVMESRFLVKKTMEMHLLILLSSLEIPESKRCTCVSIEKDLDEINPSTELVAFDTLLQDESLSEDVREIMRVTYE